MAPSAKKLEAALIDATCQVFNAEPDATSVNKVRKQTEQNLGLEENFFLGGNWKQRSKNLIKEHVVKLLDGWEPETNDGQDTHNGVKRHSSEHESPEPKRRKRSGRPKHSLKEESDPSDFEEEVKTSRKKTTLVSDRVKPADSDEEDEKPRKKKMRSRVVDSEDLDVKDEDGKKWEVLKIDTAALDAFEASRGQGEKLQAKKKRSKVVGSEDLDVKDEDGKKWEVLKINTELLDAQDEEPAAKKDGPLHDDDIKPTIEQDEKSNVEEEEEYSDVIDEPAPPKRKKGAKKEPKSKPTRPAAGASKKTTSAPEDTKETEVKKLQGQLVKCGVRKLWHNELKRFGNDERAKIRHLKQMLVDIGMDGRFSEAKAREIKELRELQAEVEAAQDMNSLWGTGAGGRASRSRVKPNKTAVESDGSDDDNDDDGDGDDNDEHEDDEETAVAARRRARADLAFLGDDSDSD